jgi:hypothetical protein
MEKGSFQCNENERSQSRTLDFFKPLQAPNWPFRGFGRAEESLRREPETCTQSWERRLSRQPQPALLRLRIPPFPRRTDGKRHYDEVASDSSLPGPLRQLPTMAAVTEDAFLGSLDDLTGKVALVTGYELPLRSIPASFVDPG